MKAKEVTKAITKTAGKAQKRIKALAAITVFAFTVYTLIPKSEKITGINPEGFTKK